MSEIIRSGRVLIQNIPAGIISETTDGYTFEYDDEYLNSKLPVSVSLTMPVEQKLYFSKHLFPFFDGLIPEGWLLSVVERNWKISQNDRFGLMLVSCRDCIGDVSVVPLEEC